MRILKKKPKREEEMIQNAIRRCPATQPNRAVKSSNKLFSFLVAAADGAEQIEFYKKKQFLAINYTNWWKIEEIQFLK